MMMVVMMTTTIITTIIMIMSTDTERYSVKSLKELAIILHLFQWWCAFVPSPKNGLKIIVSVMILIMNHVITELKLSWAIFVLCPQVPQVYICTHAKLSLSDLVEDSSLLENYLVNNPLIFQKSLMPPHFGSVQSRISLITRKKGSLSSSWRNICNL